MFRKIVAGIAVSILVCAARAEGPPLPFLEVGAYDQEVSRRYGTEHGLPDADVRCLAVTPDGRIVAGTSRGMALFDTENDVWKPAKEVEGLAFVAASHSLAATEATIYRISADGVTKLLSVPADVGKITCLLGGPEVGTGFVGTTTGLLRFENSVCEPIENLSPLIGDRPAIRSIAVTAPAMDLAVATDGGLFIGANLGRSWARVVPRDGVKSWDLVDVRGAGGGRDNALWFASPQGIGVTSGSGSRLFTICDGLPYDDFTCVAPRVGDVVWFGTKMGAISFDGHTWGYRQAGRWLPGNDVRAIAVDAKGAAWFATDKGVGVIERVPMTLKDKAKRFEDQIDKYHRRTPYEFVLSVSLDKPGDLEGGFKQHDSDNDGLWTSMYGAGECFAYAATGDPKAKARAKKAFDAMHFLGQVTQGGELSPPKGFVARSIMPTDGPDPNAGRDDVKKQREQDKLWKTHAPWWPKSKDGKWYWKSDTSSDELDGHYFFYAAYYDLVADTAEEKARVREHVLALTDHLIEHDFDLVDYDGKPTRWARYSPKNWDDVASWWAGRGLNSLSIISYLRVAQHISGGDRKYADAYEYLVNEHQYATNIMVPKWQLCPGCGNQSDDEMGFMSFYNLMKYETDPQRKQDFAFAFFNYWMIEEPELNPLFNFMYAAQCWGLRHVNPFGTTELTPEGPWLEHSIDTLKRYPLDRIEWGVKNSHRKDIVPLRTHTREGKEARGRGHRLSGYVLPIDEREVEHWNVDPWALDYSGGGGTLMDPQSFLLPYYMGLYHGFIVEK
ncbi:MAG: hypothetical protein HUU46_06855 [Candidatus Hydrogenedentes bacterium]|nr:hypothetical protein [Candidatus Hydrogenedentota bacterium]